MRFPKKIRQLMLIAVLSVGTPTVSQVQAAAYNDLVVFGDSLSDSGNIYDQFGGIFGPTTPYTEARFTSPYTNGDPGLVWVEHLAGLMGLALDNSGAGGSNYSYGGARMVENPSDFVPSLADQLGFYLGNTAGVADANSLYVVFGGGNDVRANDASGAAATFSAIISDLAAAGATDFFVPTLPDAGLTPESQAGLAPGGSAAIISQATADYNAGLLAEIATLEANPGINIITFDLADLFNDILNDPATFGMSNVVDACAGINAGTIACTDPDTYLFFDGIHPTAIVHEMMANAAFEALNPVPIPAAAWLFGSALLGLGALKRKQAQRFA